jgi:ATP-binding cassette subfamily B protein
MNKYADLISGIYQNLDSKRRRELLILIVLIIMSSFLEIISLGSFLPLLQSLVSENKSSLLLSIEDILGAYSSIKPVYIMGLAFLLVFNLNDLIRLVVIRQTNKISFGIGSDASNLILKRALLQPYEKSIEKNSSEFISAIVKKIDTYIYCVIVPIITISSSTIVALVLILFLIVLLPIYTLFLILLFIALYIPIFFHHRKALSQNDATLSIYANKEVNFLNETLFSIKDIIIDSRQEFAIRNFREITEKIFIAKSSNYTIAQSPRYVIEMISVSLIIVLSIFLFDSNYLVISTLALVALSAQRLMPHIQHIYGSYALIRSSYSSAMDILSIINAQESIRNKDEKINFSDLIEFKDVSYRFYNRDHYSVNNLNLIIKRGERIAVIGESGSGKSTFLDLLMGLLLPTKGSISVDGLPLEDKNFKAWYPKISYVSQTINILNLSLSENIALSGDKKIDQHLLSEVIKYAELGDLISRLPNGLDALLGEGGRNLSGGERQRIAIARALYKKGDILVLDEAMSALDDSTEKTILSKILQLPYKPTVVAVTHSSNCLTGYDRVVELKNGRILRVIEN